VARKDYEPQSGVQPCPQMLQRFKFLAVASTIAYYNMALITTVKRFIVQVPGDILLVVLTSHSPYILTSCLL